MARSGSGTRWGWHAVGLARGEKGRVGGPLGAVGGGVLRAAGRGVRLRVNGAAGRVDLVGRQGNWCAGPLTVQVALTCKF